MQNDHEVLTPERWRIAAALCILPIYYLVLADVLKLLILDVYRINYIYFTIGFLLVCLLFLPFLIRSVPLLFAGKERVIAALAAGAIGHYAGTFLLSAALTLCGIVPQTRNNQTIVEMIRHAPVLMFFFCVIAVPITEECLFRGALFGSLQKKHRVAAYLVTAVTFATIHAIPGIAAGSWQDAFGVLPYLAPGFALCYAYEYSGTICTSIVLHAIINAVAFVVALLN